MIAVLFLLLVASAYGTENGNPFPQCANPMTKAEDCPIEITVRGFPIYVSSYLPAVMDEIVMRWLDIADAVLLELESSRDIRPYFVERLRNSGVSFSLTFREDAWGTNAETGVPVGSMDPYHLCPPASGCYLSDLRMIQQTLIPPYSPEGERYATIPGINWTYVRYFIIHELAHAFHDIALVDGLGNQCVLDAYRFSVERDGLHAGTYAASNHHEYFAQIVSYVMRSTDGAYCGPQPVDENQNGRLDFSECPWGLLSPRWGSGSSFLPVQNKWLLAEYDFNGAALFDALLFMEGHLNVDGVSVDWELDPLLTPLADEQTLDCDASVWWPE